MLLRLHLYRASHGPRGACSVGWLSSGRIEQQQRTRWEAERLRPKLGRLGGYDNGTAQLTEDQLARVHRLILQDHESSSERCSSREFRKEG